jgi:hypothetical protein
MDTSFSPEDALKRIDHLDEEQEGRRKNRWKDWAFEGALLLLAPSFIFHILEFYGAKGPALTSAMWVVVGFCALGALFVEVFVWSLRNKAIQEAKNQRELLHDYLIGNS